jgi:hypothetical protein
MKRNILSLVITFILISATAMAQAQSKKSDKAKGDKGQVLRHVVMFKFKDSSSPEDIKKVENAFKDLAKKIKEIKDFEWGINNSPENLNQGLTHCFLVTFGSEKDREIYLPHPDHLAFVEILKPHLDKVTVIDYWAKK